jgi:hypothetical protein
MNCFVFVVCGSREHVSTLNFSLKFLRRYSKYPIVVVTDSSRNEIPIVHDNIVEVSTPEEYTHHEASIFLKTGLYRFLPEIKTNKYCYLDSDIVAVSEECNKIFNYEPEPVLFIKDHCMFNEFSPYAMNCNCLDIYSAKKSQLTESLKKVFPLYDIENNETIEGYNSLMAIYDSFKNYPLRNIKEILRYIFLRYISFKKDFLLHNFRFNKTQRIWFDRNDNMINFDFRFYRKKLSNQFGIKYYKGIWYNDKSEKIMPIIPNCEHLQEHISNKFDYNIPDNWRHWNGGVFVFNHKSIEFLEYWHKITLEEFNDDKTKTRDQGTLAVAAWKFGLQDMKTLPLKFNFITEYANPDIKWDYLKGYTYNNYKTAFKPAMLHIYHHWGDKGWSIWQSVLELGKNEGII